MNVSVFWRAAAIQTAAVALLSIALALILSHDFFEHWGWIAGPAAWVACSLFTARLLQLPYGRSLLGAALAGVPSLLAVVLGVHWLGAAIAIAVFAAWCAYLAAGRRSAPGLP